MINDLLNYTDLLNKYAQEVHIHDSIACSTFKIFSYEYFFKYRS